METRKLSELKPNPLNPRGPVTDDDALRDLAASIGEQGLLQPILITTNNVIVAGHRRVAACAIAGLSQIPVIVKDIDETAQIEIMLVENLQRQDLNLIQIGKAALELRARGLSITTISAAIGMSKDTVTRYLTVAQFPREIQPFFASGQLKLGSVSVLAGLPPKQQIYWANRAINANWKGNQLCRAIRSRTRGKSEPISDEDIRQGILSNIADKLCSIAERVDCYEDLRPIARQINEAGHAIIDAQSKRKHPRRVA